MKWLRNIMRASTLTTALFIFQACYGTPQRPYWEEGEAPMTFSLVDRTSGAPLDGISITACIREGEQPVEIGVTGTDGRCSVSIPYERNAIGPALKFQDPDGNYMPKDTVLADLREREILIELTPAE
ncbi:MAG: hypothetical protein IJS70_01820 [Bacteroidales bacterium]|nr:hypothetical protein [Bacteroidales bacterium]